MPIKEELYGNQDAKDRFRAALRDGTMPHALIFRGPAGSGRRTLARYLAAALFCEKKSNAEPFACGACESCRRIRENIFPDLHVIRPEEGKALISVEQIRAIRKELDLSGVEADCRVFLIEDADKMNHWAQNALLISLEEPPRGVFFFLISENEEALLPTVRSRCQVVRTELFTKEQLALYLADEPRYTALAGRAPEEAEALLDAAGGTLGKALLLLTGGGLSAVLRERETVDAIITALAARGKAALYEATKPLGAMKREELLSLLALLGDALRDLILVKRAQDAPLLYYYRQAAAMTVAETVGIRRLLTLYDAKEEAEESLSKNANIAVTVSAFLHTAVS